MIYIKKKIILLLLSIVIILSAISISQNDNNITELKTGWNLVSAPYKEIIPKNNITILYNNSEYSWQSAVLNNIIVDDIFGWDNGNYYNADKFLPGQGYWIYAYKNCTLIKSNPQPKLYEHWLSDNGYANIQEEIIWGQQFTIGTTGPNENFSINSLVVKLYKDEETEPGTVYFDLYTVNESGFPNNHISMGEIDGDDISSDYGGCEINVSMSQTELTMDTMYAFTVTAPYTEDPIYMRCICDDEEDPHDIYDGGLSLLSWDNGENWSEKDCSFYFKVYGL